MKRNHPVPNNETFAAVDLGSNSFHMIVCRYSHGTLQVEDRLREMVRLSEGFSDSRLLADAAQQRALACLERFEQRLRGVAQVHVVGTNTLRCARNAAAFLTKAEHALGQSIEIISGVEEARLIYLGVANSADTDQQQRLVIDIGGGSTELIIGHGFAPQRMESLHMGCVSISQRFFADGVISSNALHSANIAARMELEPIASGYRQLGWGAAIGTSGTIKAIQCALHLQQPDTDGITLDTLHHLRDHMLAVGAINKLDFKGLSAQRTALLPGGTMILLAAFEALSIERMRFSDSALREGVIHDQLNRVHHKDIRERSVESLAHRYHIDKNHAKNVTNTAILCVDQLLHTWHLDGKQSRRWLTWGAQLHEIGLDIAHSQHHKHGAYIAQNCNLAGFSRQEQQLLAALIRNHRRKISNSSFKQLSTQHERYWTILLRIAILLHRSRSHEPLPPFTLQATASSLQLTFPAQWLNRHLLTRADLEQEAHYLRAIDFNLGFC
ncbi:MAG: Ppx/GppA family phosphatase [Gammaproteobacteria bacterium]|nr:Ppx/GppA family phosphatase [Gammaproteobacteria bacterium]